MSDLSPHKTMTDEYKGNKIFKIYKIDDEGNEVEKYGTIVSFGVNKAKYILENIDKIKEFVNENS